MRPRKRRKRRKSVLPSRQKDGRVLPGRLFFFSSSTADPIAEVVQYFAEMLLSPRRTSPHGKIGLVPKDDQKKERKRIVVIIPFVFICPKIGQILFHVQRQKESKDLLFLLFGQIPILSAFFSFNGKKSLSIRREREATALDMIDRFRASSPEFDGFNIACFHSDTSKEGPPVEDERLPGEKSIPRASKAGMSPRKGLPRKEGRKRFFQVG